MNHWCCGLHQQGPKGHDHSTIPAQDDGQVVPCLAIPRLPCKSL